jgi:uncharacterized coiled-coil protein SlyX
MPRAGDEETLRDYVNDTDPHRALESSEWVRIARLLAGKLSAKQRQRQSKQREDESPPHFLYL